MLLAIRHRIGLSILILLIVAGIAELRWLPLTGFGQGVSPAGGHAAIVARGVSTLPAGDAIWRATYRTTSDRPLEQPVTANGPGFVIADAGSLLVAEASDRQAALLPGEATFVPAAPVRFAALVEGGPASYYAIEVAPADAAAPADARVVYQSEPFASFPGQHDLKLVRDVLEKNETTTVIGQGAPVLVLALQGTVRVEATDGTASPLKAGEARTFSGDVIVKGGGSSTSSFVAGVIAGEIPAELPDQSGTPIATPATPVPATAGTGVIGVVLHGCPEGTTPKEANPNTCPLEPDVMSLELSALGSDAPRSLGAPVSRDGLPVWSELGAGDYAISTASLKAGYGRFYVPGLTPLSDEDAATVSDSQQPVYRVTLSAASPAYRLDVYALPGREDRNNAGSNGGGAVESAASRGGVQDVGASSTEETNPDRQTRRTAQQSEEQPPVAVTPVSTVAVARPRKGSITVRLLQCPDTIDTFQAANCAPPQSPYALALIAPDGSIIEQDAARQEPDGSLIWENLDFGDYVLQQPLFPAGAATYYIPDGVLAPAGNGYALRIEAGAARVSTDLYNLATTESAPPPVAPVPTPPAASAGASLDVGPTPAPVIDAAAIPPAPAGEPVPAAPVEAPPPPPAGPVDTDGDSLTDEYELSIGTDPNVFDSDGDGVGDGDEALAPVQPAPVETAPQEPPPAAEAPPVEAAAAIDTDLDGISDADEAVLGTDPTNPDTDDDGFLDGNETSLGTNPQDAGQFPVQTPVP